MSEENWHERNKAMMKDLDWNHKKVAEMIGTTHDSERATMQPSKPFPRRAKLVVLVYEEVKRRNQETYDMVNMSAEEIGERLSKIILKLNDSK